jgi:hypothetical protein
MSYPWHEYNAGECVHGEPAESCEKCIPRSGPHTWIALVIAILLWAGLVALFARADDLEEAARRRHEAPWIGPDGRAVEAAPEARR